METTTFSLANKNDRNELNDYCMMLHDGNEDKALALLERIIQLYEKHQEKYSNKKRFVYILANRLYISSIKNAARKAAEAARNEVLTKYGLIVK